MGRRNEDADILEQVKGARGDISRTAESLGGEIGEVAGSVDLHRRELMDAVNAGFAGLRSENHELRDALRVAHASIATSRQEIQEVRTEIEGMRRDAAEARVVELEEAKRREAPRSEPAGNGCAAAPPRRVDGDDTGHDLADLLALAAGVAYAELVCHRDTWAFLVERASGGEHFRLPVDIKEAADGTIEADISGRTLVAAIDALWQTKEARETTRGSRHLADQIYTRIGDALFQVRLGRSRFASEGEAATSSVPRIVIDDRVPAESGDTGTSQGLAATD